MRKTTPQTRTSRRLVIGIAGRIGSGKTTAARYLAAEHNFRYLRYSQVLRKELKGTGDRDKLRALGWKIMSTSKQGELNRLLLRRIKGRGDFVVEGLRHPIDYEALNKKFRKRFCLVYIDSPANLRWRRLKKAGRFCTMMEFREADRHPVEQNVPRLRMKAHMMVTNTGSLEQFHRRLDRVADRVRKGGRP